MQFNVVLNQFQMGFFESFKARNILFWVELIPNGIFDFDFLESKLAFFRGIILILWNLHFQMENYYDEQFYVFEHQEEFRTTTFSFFILNSFKNDLFYHLNQSNILSIVWSVDGETSRGRWKLIAWKYRRAF